MAETNTTWLGRLLRRWVEPELQRTTRLLREANTQLDRALRENIRLADLCREHEEQVASLRSDNRELKAHVSRLEEGNKFQLELMAKMENRLRDLELKYDHVLANHMRLRAETGRDLDIPA